MNENKKDKRIKNNKKTRNKTLKIFRFLRLLLFVVVVTMVAVFLLSKKASSSSEKRYRSQGKYLNTLENYNLHLESKDEKVKNTIYDSLNVQINKTLEDYLIDNNIERDKISLTIVNKDNGDRINFNSDKVNHYEGLNKYFLLIVYNDLFEKNLIQETDKFVVKQYDISEESVLITENSVDQEIQVNELLRTAYRQNDPTARNILNRILVEELNTSLQNEIRKFINYNNQDYKTDEVIVLANKVSQNPNMYWEVLNKDNNKFLEYIDYSNAMTIRNETGGSYYEIGYIVSNVNYSYVIYAQDIEQAKVSEIGDLVDREMKNYYIQRKY